MSKSKGVSYRNHKGCCANCSCISNYCNTTNHSNNIIVYLLKIRVLLWKKNETHDPIRRK